MHKVKKPEENKVLKAVKLEGQDIKLVKTGDREYEIKGLNQEVLYEDWDKKDMLKEFDSWIGFLKDKGWGTVDTAHDNVVEEKAMYTFRLW